MAEIDPLLQFLDKNGNRDYWQKLKCFGFKALNKKEYIKIPVLIQSTVDKLWAINGE